MRGLWRNCGRWGRTLRECTDPALACTLPFLLRWHEDGRSGAGSLLFEERAVGISVLGGGGFAAGETALGRFGCDEVFWRAAFGGGSSKAFRTRERTDALVRISVRADFFVEGWRVRRVLRVEALPARRNDLRIGISFAAE